MHFFFPIALSLKKNKKNQSIYILKINTMIEKIFSDNQNMIGKKLFYIAPTILVTTNIIKQLFPNKIIKKKT